MTVESGILQVHRLHKVFFIMFLFMSYGHLGMTGLPARSKPREKAPYFRHPAERVWCRFYLPVLLQCNIDTSWSILNSLCA